MLAPPRHAAYAALLLSLLLAGCGSGGAPPSPSEPAPPPTPEEPEEPPLPPAPWSAGSLDASSVPPAYVEAWQGAENRDRCALLAFDPGRLGEVGADAEARTAQFGGGWGVAYDLSGQRSAFGIAGTGVEPGPDTYDDWPYQRAWQDGSRVGYGPEGGRGPNILGYLQVAGQPCLYNVWSRLGKTHLESLMDGLRFVEGAG